MCVARAPVFIFLSVGTFLHQFLQVYLKKFSSVHCFLTLNLILVKVLHLKGVDTTRVQHYSCCIQLAPSLSVAIMLVYTPVSDCFSYLNYFLFR